MVIKIQKTELAAILSLRIQFLAENNCQIRFNAVHERGWSDSYLLLLDGQTVGYGSVKGRDKVSDRDAIFEFYVLPDFRKYASRLFSALVKTTAVRYVVNQSNVALLQSLLFEFTKSIKADVVLFQADFEAELCAADTIFRPRLTTDPIFKHQAEPEGDFVLLKNGEIVGTGGFLLHYNAPFADLYMEVVHTHRKQGLGSLLIQELIKACYVAGHTPAARCNIENRASKATLLKGGMREVGYMMTGTIEPKRLILN
jgi:GNAT superfamily N-acetyltransferase